MDVTALSDILDQTGPVESPGYGQLTAQNIVRKVLVDAYRQYPEEVPGNNEIRRDLNDGLRQTFQSLVTDPANLPAVLRGITEAIPGGARRATWTMPPCRRPWDRWARRASS